MRLNVHNQWKDQGISYVLSVNSGRSPYQQSKVINKINKYSQQHIEKKKYERQKKEKEVFAIYV